VQATEQLIVVGMAANPEPYWPLSDLHRECAMIAADPRRPEGPDLLEVKRRVTVLRSVCLHLGLKG